LLQVIMSFQFDGVKGSMPHKFIGKGPPAEAIFH